MKEKFYITTAIAYTSDKPHVGNTYDIVLSDSIARYQRLLGKDVYFLTGSDEHGQKIENYAKNAGIEPQKYVDGVAGQIQEIWKIMNSSHDQFIRTTNPKHKLGVQKIFKKLYDQGDIYMDTYKGMYCIPDETFYSESQLVDGKCPDCGREVRYTEEEAYFFKMSKYQDRLLKHIEENPNFIQPDSRRNEMVNTFLKPGLQDLCVSRTSFKWGIPVSFAENHVVYVWIDALSNYITALGYDPDSEVQPELFNKYWPANLHVIGKDILRFHTIYWPIMLMALDLPLPKQVLGHPWLLVGEDKMSKSVGNVIYADDLAAHFGTDGVRHYLLAHTPFANDGSITHESMILSYNTDLANTLGNLVSRTTSMIKQNFESLVPEPSEALEIDEELEKSAEKMISEYRQNMDTYHLSAAVKSVFDYAKRCNKYIDETQPWALAKDESQMGRLATVLYNLVEEIRKIAILLSPIIPASAEKIMEKIGVKNDEFAISDLDKKITPGTKVEPGEALFARIDEEKMLKVIEKEAEEKRKQAKTMTDIKPDEKEETSEEEITFEGFMKVKLIAGEIRKVQKIEKADKLLKLQVFDGENERQVVSGIAQFYDEESLLGKKIVLVANLKPAKLRGETSQGMILALDTDDKKIEVVFLSDDTKPGSIIR